MTKKTKLDLWAWEWEDCPNMCGFTLAVLWGQICQSNSVKTPFGHIRGHHQL